MILKYVYTSKHFEGEVLLWYDSDKPNLLVMFDMSKAEFDSNQHVAFLRNFPRSLDELELLIEKDSANRKMVQYFDNVTFDLFWERYDHKRLSSKIKTEKIWNKMSDSEKYKAYFFVERYENDLRCSGGIAKKHAETYLNAALWNN
jgi:hypothetical protein